MGENAAVGLVGEGLAVATGVGPVDMTALARTAAKQALVQLGSAPNLAFVFVAAADAEDAEQALLAANRISRQARSSARPPPPLWRAAGQVTTLRRLPSGRPGSPGCVPARSTSRCWPADQGDQIVGTPGPPSRRCDGPGSHRSVVVPHLGFRRYAQVLLTDLPRGRCCCFRPGAGPHDPFPD